MSTSAYAILTASAIAAAATFSPGLARLVQHPPILGSARLPVSRLQASDTSVRTPAAGSATRRAVLDAIRARLGVQSQFRVTHVRATTRWAFVRCVQVETVDGDLQETDLDVAALLERREERWIVVEHWTLTDDETSPYTPFARRVRARARADRLPASLFPPGFLTSDVPVE